MATHEGAVVRAKAQEGVELTQSPDLTFLIPPASENRWSDLLAALIATDPEPISTLVGGWPDEVWREVVVQGQNQRESDRLDLLLLSRGRPIAAIEVKLLSDLGPTQLTRYDAAFPEVRSRFVLHLDRLPVSAYAAPQWRQLTWESVLEAYAESNHPWVSSTARAWHDQLDRLAPSVDATTVWNHVPDDAAGFELALRTRLAWLAQRMDNWCQIDHGLSLSSGGGAWVAAMRGPELSDGHRVVAEVQEGLPARSWRPDSACSYRSRLLGPTILVALSQAGVSTSAGFDWALLHRLFLGRVVDGTGRIIDGRGWQTTSANPRSPTDRDNWKRMVEGGAPGGSERATGWRLPRPTGSARLVRGSS